MNLTVREFPNCCTAKVLTGLGQTTLSMDNGGLSASKEELVSLLNNQIRFYKTEGRRAVLVVTTNSDQVSANEALEECGFIGSEWMSKGQHPETQIKLWHFPLNK